MKNIYVKIKGIHCESCISKITSSLSNISNIKNVEIKKDIACISYEGKLNINKVIKTINDLDYETDINNVNSDITKLDTSIKLKEFVIILTSILLVIFLIKSIFGFNIFNAIPTIDSNIYYGMLVVIGFLTSIHCISMCGAINLAATYNSDVKVNLKRPILYNLGRLISYTLIGGLVGLLGSVLSINETVKGIIIIICAILMTVMSLRMLGILKFNFWHFKSLKIKTNKAFIIGLLNGFMPCGPLQSMQIYALSTSSFFKGALSMFLFCLGTIPLMLTTGIIFNLFKGKYRILLNKVAATLILVLSIFMFYRGLMTLGVNDISYNTSYTSATIYDDYQTVTIDLSYDSYGDVILLKDVPVRMIINVDKKYLTGCNEEVYINEYDIKQKLEVGENIIEFTPTETGEFTYNCWMNMIKNKIKVIDNENYFKRG